MEFRTIAPLPTRTPSKRTLLSAIAPSSMRHPLPKEVRPPIVAPDLTSLPLRYRDRRQQGHVFRDIDGLVDAHVPKLWAASDRAGEDVVGGRKVAAGRPDVPPVGTRV